jgi:hypothetical protein
MGLCYVTEKAFEGILSHRLKVIKALKRLPLDQNSDIKWANIFVMYVTHEQKDIDLRLQKG